MQLRLQTRPDLSVCLILRAFQPKGGGQARRGTDASDDKDKEPSRSETPWVTQSLSGTSLTCDLHHSGQSNHSSGPVCGPQPPSRFAFHSRTKGHLRIHEERAGWRSGAGVPNMDAGWPEVPATKSGKYPRREILIWCLCTQKSRFARFFYFKSKIKLSMTIESPHDSV